MGVNLSSQCRKLDPDERLNTLDWFLLLNMTTIADDGDGTAYPSQATLTEWCKKDPNNKNHTRQIEKSMAKLKAAEYFYYTGARIGRGHQWCVGYMFNLKNEGARP